MSNTKQATPTRVLVAYLKGGVGKSTTAMMLAFAWSKRGKNVMVIDADAGTQGVTDWASRFYAAHPEGELPFDVFQWAPRYGLLTPWVRGRERETSPDITILDVGGEAPEVLSQAAVMADVVVGPTQPTQADLGRIMPTRTVVQKANPSAEFVISLNRVSYIRSGAARDAREMLEEDGLTVLNTEVTNSRGRYADVWGRIPANMGAYWDMSEELSRTVARMRREAA